MSTYLYFKYLISKLYLLGHCGNAYSQFLFRIDVLSKVISGIVFHRKVKKNVLKVKYLRGNVIREANQKTELFDFKRFEAGWRINWPQFLWHGWLLRLFLMYIKYPNKTFIQKARVDFAEMISSFPLTLGVLTSYFPIQKFLKIFPNTSSLVISPVISPR